jgi:hypothetical protein
VSSKREQIRQKAIEILKENPNGLRWTELLKRLQAAFPLVPWNTIQGNTWNLDTISPNEVYKPARGHWRHASFKDLPLAEPPKMEISRGGRKIIEDDFYQPVADYLQGELEECSKAIPLGGDRFRDKWGTPDVIGILKAPPSAILAPPTEVVTAEIKINTSELVTAFGQACAYKSFSHRSYLAVPKQSRKDDLDKLDALCNIFGIGLILFDSTNPKAPAFEIKVRAAKHDPDMFFMNKYMKFVEKELFT